MKIEKVSNNQIRCTLTKQDLADRELKLSELAYGSEKAKRLFRDMMQQASYEVGFEAEDIPLMIEAIPVSEDCIILTVTKVENPDELDTRFSKFSEEGEETDNSIDSSMLTGADEILDLYKRIKEEKRRIEKQKEEAFVPLDQAIQSQKNQTQDTNTNVSETKQETIAAPEKNLTFNLVKIYQFNDLDTVGQLSVVLKNFYNGNNSLYKNNSTSKYFLILNKDNHTPEDFNKTCNILSEYGVQSKYAVGTEAYFKEHYTVIKENNAIQQLAEINS